MLFNTPVSRPRSHCCSRYGSRQAHDKGEKAKGLDSGWILDIRFAREEHDPQTSVGGGLSSITRITSPLASEMLAGCSSTAEQTVVLLQPPRNHQIKNTSCILNMRCTDSMELLVVGRAGHIYLVNVWVH